MPSTAIETEEVERPARATVRGSVERHPGGDGAKAHERECKDGLHGGGVGADAADRERMAGPGRIEGLWSASSADLVASTLFRLSPSDTTWIRMSHDRTLITKRPPTCC